jgi:hypothetical protein
VAKAETFCLKYAFKLFGCLYYEVVHDLFCVSFKTDESMGKQSSDELDFFPILHAFFIPSTPKTVKKGLIIFR